MSVYSWCVLYCTVKSIGHTESKFLFFPASLRNRKFIYSIKMCLPRFSGTQIYLLKREMKEAEKL